jgi:nicotinamide mononucleotide transporter
MSVPTAMMQWLNMHYIELLATVTGILYILFTIREKILLWLFGIVSSALFVWVFFKSSIYAYSFLYIYYVIMGFYGWYNWSHPPDPKEGSSNHLSVHKASSAGLIICIAVSLLFAFPVYLLLRKFSDSDVAWLDALLSSSGMVATWMLTQKMIEQWIFWIAIDLLSCSLMIYKGLYPSSLLFAAYALLALKGYIEWKKRLASTVAK